jgi:hypothetical protein
MMDDLNIDALFEAPVNKKIQKLRLKRVTALRKIHVNTNLMKVVTVLDFGTGKVA